MTEQALPGRTYRHYKGVLYRVLMVVTESTNARCGARVVVYIGDAAHGVHCRDEAEFLEPVPWPDGTVRARFCLEGK